MFKKIAVLLVLGVVALVVAGCIPDIDITGKQPRAVIGIKTTRFQPNESFCVDAFHSYASEGSALVQYEWDFGDGRPADPSGYSSYCHSYRQGGEYFITLVVIDDQGRRSSPDTMPVTVNYHPVPAAYLEEITDWPSGQAFYRIPDGRKVYPRSSMGPMGIVPQNAYTYWKIVASSWDPDGWIVSKSWSWSDLPLGNEEVLWLMVPADGSVYTNLKLNVIDNEGLGVTNYYDLVSPLG